MEATQQSNRNAELVNTNRKATDERGLNCNLGVHLRKQTDLRVPKFTPIGPAPLPSSSLFTGQHSLSKYHEGTKALSGQALFGALEVQH